MVDAGGMQMRAHHLLSIALLSRHAGTKCATVWIEVDTSIFLFTHHRARCLTFTEFVPWCQINITAAAWPVLHKFNNSRGLKTCQSNITAAACPASSAQIQQ